MKNKVTLLLNSSYSPVAPICWQRALVLVLKGKADLLETYDEEVRSPSTTLRKPAVVRLKTYFANKCRMAKFTKKAVCARDNHECGYCGKRLSPNEVTFDHILPQSRGGATDWTNLVVACKFHNQMKGNRTPNEAGMLLMKKAYAPTYFLGINSVWGTMRTPAQWSAWLPATKGEK